MELVTVHLLAKPTECGGQAEFMQYRRTQVRHKMSRVGQGLVDDVFGLLDHVHRAMDGSLFGLAQLQPYEHEHLSQMVM